MREAVNANPVIGLLGRRLRLAVIGGGPGSLIGGMHRQAARLDDAYELVAGALSSDPSRAVQAGLDLGLSPNRAYASGLALLDAEAAHSEGADVVAIMTPNDSHFEFAMVALERGFDVICDKPMTNTLAQARALHEAVRRSGRVFCLTHNYTGYAMVRKARSMVAAGQLGVIRLVQVEYVQGRRASDSRPHGQAPRRWRDEQDRGGPSLVMGDVGTHAHHLMCFVTGLAVSEVAAEVGAVVPERTVHDYAGALLRLHNGARGIFWVTQAAAGVGNSLRIRVSGSLGTLEWAHEAPQTLTIRPLPASDLPGLTTGSESQPVAARAATIVSGPPEGMQEGFAALYRSAALAIATRRTRGALSPTTPDFPGSLEGLRGIEFIDCVLRSHMNGGAWTPCVHAEDSATPA